MNFFGRHPPKGYCPLNFRFTSVNQRLAEIYCVLKNVVIEDFCGIQTVYSSEVPTSLAFFLPVQVTMASKFT